MHELEHRAGVPRHLTRVQSNISPVQNQKPKKKKLLVSGGTCHEQSLEARHILQTTDDVSVK